MTYHCHWCLLDALNGRKAKALPEGFMRTLFDEWDDLNGMRKDVYQRLTGPYGHIILKAMLIKWQDENQ